MLIGVEGHIRMMLGISTPWSERYVYGACPTRPRLTDEGVR